MSISEEHFKNIFKNIGMLKFQISTNDANLRLWGDIGVYCFSNMHISFQYDTQNPDIKFISFSQSSKEYTFQYPNYVRPNDMIDMLLEFVTSADAYGMVKNLKVDDELEFITNVSNLFISNNTYISNKYSLR